MCMIPLTRVLNKAKVRYTLAGGKKNNHLLFKDNLKLYRKSKSEIKRLVPTAEALSQDIGMEFGIKKCGGIIMNKGKVKSRNRIELSNSE